ncbi:MAG TPA: hypothetical protein VHE35_03665 [Kofleriaceae bacterium]|nr:hypothetical protein [Kofleriaceae bacterium]
MSIAHPDDLLWQAYCDALRLMVNARMALVARAHDLSAVIAIGLAAPAGRACALQLLLALPAETSRPHIARLVELATFSQADIAFARQIIHRLHDADAMMEVERAAETHLATGGEWEYRRIAELYDGLDHGRLLAHLARCASHGDEAIREIARDFRSEIGPTG